MQIWALIVDSFRESRDKKLFWIMLIVSTMAAAALACVGFDENGWSFFFGLIKRADPELTRGSAQAAAVMGALVSSFLVGTYIGWLGVVACLTATAGMFPSFLQSGSIDVVLGKPMSRAAIFAGKYLGSLGFVLVQAAYFVLLTLVILRWQLGAWLWGYLWAIPLLVALFSYIYCVCVLVGIWSRSTLASLICALLFWVGVAGVALTESTWGWTENGGPPARKLRWQERDTFGRTIFVLHAVLPKTEDIETIVGRQMQAAHLDELLTTVLGDGGEVMSEDDKQLLQSEADRLETASAAPSVGSSLAFEGVVLLLAWWLFSRKDF